MKDIHYVPSSPRSTAETQPFGPGPYITTGGAKIRLCCAQHNRMTNQIVAAIIERRGVLWVTRNGAVSREPMPILKTVETVLKDPEPDQSWMTTPIPRSRFHHWIPGQK